ncbi:MAG TPA: SDR family NAD(P)-dependent oxidoreductase [Acidimicrobiales bacterium]|nr:SDR family NAD(P)-dependent oxidoreductase [Acidimicrobiales bacterium]
MPGFDQTSTTDDVLEGIDLSGKHALVTGASAGIGVETVRALAAHGASVTMAVRDRPKAEDARDRILESVPDAQLELRELDLASLASVRAFCAGYLADRSSLDLLIGNAGIMACPQGTTVDGFELQFGTNHLGHFLLCRELLPLVSHPGARVVLLSSSGHRLGDVSLDDWNFERTPYDPWVAYGRSKTANVLCAVALDARLDEHDAQAAAVHPGFIITELGRHLTRETFQQLQDMRDPDVVMFQKTVEQGAATTCYAAAHPDVAGQPAWFYEDCGRAELADESAVGQARGVRPYALDPDRAEQLWALSERLVDAAKGPSGPAVMPQGAGDTAVKNPEEWGRQ